MAEHSRSKRLSSSLRSFADRIIPDRMVMRSRPSSTNFSSVDESINPVTHHRRRQSLGSLPVRMPTRSLSTRSEGGNTRRHSGLWIDRRPMYGKAHLRDENPIHISESSWNSRRWGGKSYSIDTPRAYFSVVPETDEKSDSRRTSFVELEPLEFSPSSFVISLSSDSLSSESWLSLSPSPIERHPCSLPAHKPTQPISTLPQCSSLPPEMDGDDSQDESDDDEDWLFEEFVPFQSKSNEKTVETTEQDLDWREFHKCWLESDDSYPIVSCEL